LRCTAFGSHCQSAVLTVADELAQRSLDALPNRRVLVFGHVGQVHIPGQSFEHADISVFNEPVPYRLADAIQAHPAADHPDVGAIELVRSAGCHCPVVVGELTID